jgi:hypothetical protein
MVKTKLFVSQIVLQIIARHAGADRAARRRRRWSRLAPRVRVHLYRPRRLLTLIGIFAMRWNSS